MTQQVFSPSVRGVRLQPAAHAWRALTAHMYAVRARTCCKLEEHGHVGTPAASSGGACVRASAASVPSQVQQLRPPEGYARAPASVLLQALRPPMLWPAKCKWVAATALRQLLLAITNRHWVQE